MEEKNRTYEYMEIQVEDEKKQWYIASYQRLGWELEEVCRTVEMESGSVLRFKRYQEIINKAELIRLQHHFEACADEIRKLEGTKRTASRVFSGNCASLGGILLLLTGFLVSGRYSTPFVPAFLGLSGIAFLGISWLGYDKVEKWQEKRVAALIQGKLSEADGVCEKAAGVLLR